VKNTARFARSSLVLAALCLAPLARAEELTPKFERYMDAAVKVEGFSGSVLVSRGGETLFARGYSLANIDHQVPNTPRTKFRIASITKQFTAMAVLILAEQGKLKLDDPIGKYIESAPKPWEKVTIHHLLTHTSGIYNYTADPRYPEMLAQPETVPSLIARFKDRPLDFPTGEKFSYCNSGYILLGAVIEKVSSMSYEAFLTRAIFGPLGMKDTGYDHSETIFPHRAAGYERAGNGLKSADYVHMSQPFSAGALYSTVEDLARWDRALNDEKLISKESYTRMYTPGKGDYAYGWMVGTLSGRKEIEHGGSINGFKSQIVRDPDQEVCVVVLCNVYPCGTLKVAHDLAAIALGDAYKVPEERAVAEVDPKVLDSYVGRYETSGFGVMTITRDGNHLQVQSGPLMPRMIALPASKSEFFVKFSDVSLTFVKDARGLGTHLLLRQGKLEIKAKRLEESGETSQK
jgi:CubicO group peptidase (beta-lactamase class C family)